MINQHYSGIECHKLYEHDKYNHSGVCNSLVARDGKATLQEQETFAARKEMLIYSVDEKYYNEMSSCRSL